MIVAALALVIAPVQDEVPKPMPTADALALFKRVCVDTFPNPARFAAAIKAEPDTYVQKVIIPGMKDGPSGSYMGERAEVIYAAADGLPRELPSRQCGLLTQAGSAADHATLAAAMTAALSLPVGKTYGDGRMLTEWNVPRPVGKVRYVLITRPLPDGGCQISMSVRDVRS